jgi:hypothetical protein
MKACRTSTGKRGKTGLFRLVFTNPNPVYDTQRYGSEFDQTFIEWEVEQSDKNAQ